MLFGRLCFACAFVNGLFGGLAVGLGFVVVPQQAREDGARPGAPVCVPPVRPPLWRSRQSVRGPMQRLWSPSLSLHERMIRARAGGCRRRRIGAYWRSTLVLARPAVSLCQCCEAADAQWPPRPCADACARRRLQLNPLLSPFFIFLLFPCCTVPSSPFPDPPLRTATNTCGGSTSRNALSSVRPVAAALVSATGSSGTPAYTYQQRH